MKSSCDNKVSSIRLDTNKKLFLLNIFLFYIKNASI